MAAPPLLEGFAGLPVEVVQASAACGRVVVSTAALPAGTSVCTSALLAASALQDNRKRVCALCLRTSLRRLDTRCDTCQQAWFCPHTDAAACAAAAAGLSVAPHDQMCPALAHLTSARFDKQLIAMLRLMLELLYLVSTGSSRAFDQLGYHSTSLEEQGELAKPFVLLRACVNSCVWGSELDLCAEKLEQMFSRIETNVHGIYHGSTAQLVGHGMYPSAAMFNHSCAPNCKLDSDKVEKLTITTVVPVESATELTVSYIALDKPVTARRKALRQQYNFECNCERCVEELARGKSQRCDVNNTQQYVEQPTNDDSSSQTSHLSQKSMLKQLKSNELKAELKSRGLKTHGTRKQLIERLLLAPKTGNTVNSIND